MKSALSDLDDASLARLGAEAAQLVRTGELEALHAKFGYALAFARDPVSALREDLEVVLSEVGATSFSEVDQPNITVSHFQPSGTGLTSLVECLLTVSNGRKVLVELVTTGKGSEAWLTLEQISAVT
jgi:hypothetical protein